MAQWRNENVGFIFQQFNLIPVLTALENVELPLKLTRLKRSERIEHAATALKLVGLGDRLKHLPRQLSGGQEQRVNEDFHKTIVMVTHDPHAAEFATRVHHLEKGELKAVA